MIIRNLNKIIVVSIILVIIFMSIGYSALNKNLSVSGELTYRPKGNIRITNVTQATLTNATLQYADFSKNEINFAYSSTTTSATIALKVEVTNYTDTQMGILKIDNLPSNATITDYTLKTKLTNTSGALKTGMSTTFTIALKPTAIETKAITLKFDFEPVYTVKYIGFSSTNGYKTEVLKGDTYSQNFGSNGPGAVYISMGGSAVSNYTYTNKVLTVPSVNGNIEITVLMASHLYYDNSKTGLPCDDVQCALDEINKMIK